jgi:hypothetical protein
VYLVQILPNRQAFIIFEDEATNIIVFLCGNPSNCAVLQGSRQFHVDALDISPGRGYLLMHSKVVN